MIRGRRTTHITTGWENRARAAPPARAAAAARRGRRVLAHGTADVVPMGAAVERVRLARVLRGEGVVVLVLLDVLAQPARARAASSTRGVPARDGLPPGSSRGLSGSARGAAARGARLAQAADFVVAFLYMFTSSCKRPTSLSTLESVAWLMASGTGATTAADVRERRAYTTPRAAARSAYQSVRLLANQAAPRHREAGAAHVEPGPPIDRSVRWRTPRPHLQMPPECRRR